MKNIEKTVIGNFVLAGIPVPDYVDRLSRGTIVAAVKAAA